MSATSNKRQKNALFGFKKIRNMGFATISLAMIFLLAQCQKEEIDIVACSGTTPTYTQEIKAIMDLNCAISGCHNASSKKSGYDLSSYNGTKAAAAKTAFLGSIQHKSGYSDMPKGKSQLSSADLEKIACWVQNNTPE
jgi:mono/diheme cytochrome c family protein